MHCYLSCTSYGDGNVQLLLVAMMHGCDSQKRGFKTTLSAHQTLMLTILHGIKDSTCCCLHCSNNASYQLEWVFPEHLFLPDLVYHT